MQGLVKNRLTSLEKTPVEMGFLVRKPCKFNKNPVTAK